MQVYTGHMLLRWKGLVDKKRVLLRGVGSGERGGIRRDGPASRITNPTPGSGGGVVDRVCRDPSADRLEQFFLVTPPCRVGEEVQSLREGTIIHRKMNQKLSRENVRSAKRSGCW